MTTEKAMTVRTPGALELPDEQQFTQSMEAINRFQRIVHATMVKDHDYGIIPGTQKPTLLKPGAEKIAKLLHLADTYVILDKAENWEKGFFRYMVKCTLSHIPGGEVISEGLGECNSMEARYRWREAKRACPECGEETIIPGKKEWGGGWLCFKKLGGCGAKFNDGDPAIESQKVGRVENEDIYSQVNTILKMAKKRALVDASLSAGRLSDVFTQDMEDAPPQKRKPQRPVGPSTGEILDGAEETPATQGGTPSQTVGVPQNQPTPAVTQGQPRPTEATKAQPDPDPSTLKTINDLYKVANKRWGMQPKDVLTTLGHSAQSDISLPVWECYLALKVAKGEGN